jgi:hypothetical protein
VQEGSAFKALLITRGRKSGAEHAVWLRAVAHSGRIYFSRRNENSDWLKNAIANPQVRVMFEGSEYNGLASLVTDINLAEKISMLKYPGEERAQETRIIVEVTIKNGV